MFAALLPCGVTLSRTHTPAHSTCPWVLPWVGVTQTRKPSSPLMLPHPHPRASWSPGTLQFFLTLQGSHWYSIPHMKPCPPSLLLLFPHHIIETTAISHSGIRKWRSQTGDVAQLVECLPNIHEPRIRSRHRINWA